MAVSKTLSANGSNGHHKFTLVVKETATSTTNNTSTISITFTLSPVSTGWDWEDHSSVKGTVTVAGTEYTWACPTYNGSSTVTLVSKTKTIEHGTDGTKSISLKFSVSSSSSYAYLPGTASASGTLALTAIPRYGTAVQSLNTKTETSIKMNWSSDSTVDYIWWSKDNGSTWTGVNVTDGKSGTYTISSGINPNTPYKIKTRIRRKDSQLTTDSSALSVTTYAYPYAKTMPDFTLGSSVKITLENPLSRSCTVRLQKSSGTDFSPAITGTTTGTTITFTPTAEQITNMYANIRSASSATYYVRTTYGSNNTDKAGGKYSANATASAPVIGTVTYADTNSTTTGATGSNQYIVQEKSQVKLTLPSSNITLQYDPQGISSVKATIEGQDYPMPLSGTSYVMSDACSIQTSGTVTAKVTVTDSRGMSGTKDVPFTVYDYKVPTINATVTRRNNFEDDTIIAASYTHSPVSIGGVDKNSLTVTYQTKLTSAANYSSEQTYTQHPQTVVTLSNTNAYNVKVIARDTMGSMVYKEYTVPVGYPLMFFDTKNSSVSINCFPSGDVEKQFVVNGSVGINATPTDQNQLVVSGSVGINSMPTAQNQLIVNGIDIIDWITPKELFPTKLEVANVTIGSMQVWRSAGICMFTLEVTLGAAFSSWTTIATGFPLPATAVHNIGWFDTADGWGTEFKRNMRVVVNDAGNLSIRYGTAASYRISIAYPIHVA